MVVKIKKITRLIHDVPMATIEVEWGNSYFVGESKILCKCGVMLKNALTFVRNSRKNKPSKANK